MSSVIKSAQQEYEDWRSNTIKKREQQRLLDENIAYLEGEVKVVPVPPMITKQSIRPETAKQRTSLLEARKSQGSTNAQSNVHFSLSKCKDEYVGEMTRPLEWS